MRTLRVLLGGAVIAAVAACSGDFTGDRVMGPAGPDFSDADYGNLWVLKHGPEGQTFSFEASESPATGSLRFTSFDMQPGDNVLLWSTQDPLVTATVTVAELESSTTQVDSVIVRIYVDGTLTSDVTYYDQNEVEVAGMSLRQDAMVKFFNSETEDGGGEGCTPGFWRQTQHFDSWVGYDPMDLFDDVFGVSYGGTLLDAVWARGGGVDALARHSVAALLNAASPDVDYPFTETQVIDAVVEAFGSEEFEPTKDMFEGWNEAGCFLD